MKTEMIDNDNEEYGSYLFPEDEFNGYWRIQTDNPGIRSKMRKITRDDRSP